MTNTKNTKRALLSSVLALFLCFAMLLGTTYAWFTDSVTSAGNKIVAGTLDVDLFLWNSETESIEITEESAPIFGAGSLAQNNNAETLWEPGKTQVAYLSIKNNGSLDLKYRVAIKVYDVENDLIDVLEYDIIPDAQFGEVTAWANEGIAVQEGTNTTEAEEVALGAGDEHFFALSVHMLETATNEYQNGSVSFDIKVLATQIDSESDSFDNQYDAGLTPIEDGDVLVEENNVQYLYTPDGKAYVYLVGEEYTESTFVVPEGITNIGNYAFAYNSNVKEVVLSSTVTSLGRGFDSSSVEKVVLNEGLEQIDSRAFRSTTALQEVVISSTVKTIADNAFQKSGIKTITIPATVETIGEAAFGASLIETVIIEGNTSIQGYAFRGCKNLRTVYLKGDDVTFITSTLNGRNSMWFCNGESNNPNTSNITFYVENETVAARVKTAMGAEAGNTPVIINETLFVNVKNATELQNALNNATQDTIINITADITGDVAFTQKKNISLVVNGNDKTMTNGSFEITARAGKDNPATLTIKNINFTTTDTERTFIHSEETNYYPNNITISNCTFEGTGAGSDVVAVKVKSANNLVIENCKANNVHSLLQNTSGWNLTVKKCEVTNAGRGMSLGTVQGALIEDVKIDASAEKYGIRIDAAYSVTATIKNCEISAFCPVVVRKASVDYNLVFEGENTMTAANTDGIWCAIGTSEYETNGSLPTAATGDVTVTLTDAALDANGIYGAAN